jgi:hypothetical protein
MDSQVRREPRFILDHQGQLVQRDQLGCQEQVVTLEDEEDEEDKDPED